MLVTMTPRRHSLRAAIGAASLALILQACVSGTLLSDDAGTTGSGGRGSGGTLGTGGATVRGTGGTTVVGTGGAPAGTGGMNGSGGSLGTGGKNIGTGGGSVGTGGAPAGTGGAVGVGGAPGTGGKIGTGGKPGTGGAVGIGGEMDAGADTDGDGAGMDSGGGDAPTGTGGMSGMGGAPGSGGAMGTGGATAVNLIMDPSAEGTAPGPWTRINQCGTYAQSTAFAHTGTHSAATTGRNMAVCGVANGSLPLVAGTYSVSLYALFDPGSTGLTTMPFRLRVRTDCSGSGQNYLTIVDSVTAQAGMWTPITGSFTVSTTAPVPAGDAGCSVAGQTISKIYVYIEQSSGTVFPDIYMDDLDVH